MRRVALFAVIALLLSSEADAAFEWAHRQPRAWVGGGASMAWPLPASAPNGLRLLAAASRPWQWPGLRASSAVVSHKRERSWGVAAGFGVLDAGVAAERTAALAARMQQGRRSMTFVVRSLELSGSTHRTTGLVVSGGAGWSHAAWRAELVVWNAWRSLGAQRLGLTAALRASIHRAGPTWSWSAGWSDEAEAGVFRWAARVRVIDELWIGASIASREPRLRGAVLLDLGPVALDVGWLVHATLPTTYVTSVAWTP